MRLKLFLSHSSRPPAGEEGDEQTRQNWSLLQETCRELDRQFGDRIKIVVDYQGLHPGEDWEKRLNEWLAECHAAIILFSRRALAESNWVKKEATILSWRAALHPAAFKLFPVFFTGQTTPAQLDDDPYFATLNITRQQCLTVEADASRIVEGLQPGLEQLVREHPIWQTPFDRLVGAVARTLDRAADAATLAALWEDQFPGMPPPASCPGEDAAKAFADAFARDLLARESGHLDRLEEILDGLHPRPAVDTARELFRFVRPLWITAEQGAHLPKAHSDGRLLALNGRLAAASEPASPGKPRDAGHFTLDRLRERAWPGSDRVWVIGVSPADSVEAIQAQIRRGYGPDLIDVPGETIDRRIRKRSEGWKIIVFIPTAGDIPDCRLLHEIEELGSKHYPGLIFLFHVGEQMPEPQDLGNLLPVSPPIDPEREADQYDAECMFHRLLENCYPG